MRATTSININELRKWLGIDVYLPTYSAYAVPFPATPPEELEALPLALATKMPEIGQSVGCKPFSSRCHPHKFSKTSLRASRSVYFLQLLPSLGKGG